MYSHSTGVAKGGGGPGTPNPIPLKLWRIKSVRTTHALRIRLIELWMSWMHWELRSINCYEFVGYFGQQLARLCKHLVLRWRHLCRVPRTVTNVVQGKRSQWWKFTEPPQSKILATPMSHSAWSVTTHVPVCGCGKGWGGGIVKRVFQCLQHTFKDTFRKYLDKMMILA